MKNELVGIYKPYASQARSCFCYKCHERIDDDLVFTRHIMKEETLEFRHYHLGCAPKRFKEYMIKRLKDFVRTEDSKRLEDVKTAMNKILKPIEDQTGPPNVSQIVTHSIVSALLKVAEGIES